MIEVATNFVVLKLIEAKSDQNITKWLRSTARRWRCQIEDNVAS